VAKCEVGLPDHYSSNWHPLTWISHMLDVQLFGFKPAGHHFTSLLFTSPMRSC